MREITFSSSGVSFCTSDWLTFAAVVVGLAAVAFVAAAILRRRTKTK